MTFSITSVLALFTLVALSAAVFFTAKRFKIPYTILLVFVGLLLVPIVNLPGLSTVFGFLGDAVLTPEMLFFIFLPVLIFESGFNMNIRRVLDNIWSIGLISTVGLLISTVVIAALLMLLLPLVGFDIPLILALLFGAIISATDPVAVLSMFKEARAPRRLSMIFEGESLFNDGTAVALFFVLLAVATDGFHGAATFGHAIFDLSVMVVAGIAIGLFMAAVLSRFLRFTKSNEFVTATLLIISAHLVFILSEFINTLGYFHISAIIATTVSSLFLGNYARHTVTPETNRYLGKLIEHMAFVANSLVFLLAGLLFANTKVDFGQLWLPIVITIIVVAVARLVSVYAVIVPLNKLKLESHIPSSWLKLLSWASLRGALAIIVVLMIPEDLTIEGWNYAYSPRDFLLALTIGCILATLFIKAPFIGPLVRRYKLNVPEPLQQAHQADLGIYYLLTEQTRLLSHKAKGFVSSEEYDNLVSGVQDKIDIAENERKMLVEAHGRSLFDRSLHLAMVDIEKTILERLYKNNEVNERVYRRIYGKLSLQTEKIEHNKHDEIDPAVYTDRKDIFDRLMNFALTLFDKKLKAYTVEERLQYYRAQMIIARKAVQIVKAIQAEHGQPVFLEDSYQKVVDKYQQFKEKSAKKVDNLVAQHGEELTAYLARLAQASLSASGARALAYLSDHGLTNEETEEAIVHKYRS